MSRTPVPTRRVAAVLLAALALVLTACSSSGGGKPSTTPSSPLAATPVPTSKVPLTSATPTPTKHKVKKKHKKPRPKPTHKLPHSRAAMPPPIHVHASSVYAVGDSVMIDAEPSLYNDVRGIHVDAAVSRQTYVGIGIVQSQRDSGTLANTTVFGLGTNGTFSDYQLNRLIDLTAGHHLIVITSHCPYCSWTASNNAMIHRLCVPSRHCYIADFQAEAQDHPEWFVGDGVHMPQGGAGAQAYARIVAQTYASIP